MFSETDVDRIEACLKPVERTFQSDHHRLKLSNADDRRMLVLELYPEVRLGRNLGSMVVVYTSGGHLQLHNCTGFVISEELGEVTFVGESEGRLSGLVVEREAACSLYANVTRDLISGDFTKLGVEVMLSGVALSLAEGLLGEDKSE
ncbi:MAG TPA: hypothetical protein VM118_09615 [Acidobacteriota bacterium]|nr:hypothetical protein [Acidobacteriota bacterium]